MASIARKRRTGNNILPHVEESCFDDEEDPKEALARVELERKFFRLVFELKCCQLELRRNKLLAKVRSVKARRDSGKSSAGSISSQSVHSRLGERVVGEGCVRSDRASQFEGRSVSLTPSIALRDVPAAERVDVPVVNAELECIKFLNFGAINAAQTPVMEASKFTFSELEHSSKKTDDRHSSHAEASSATARPERKDAATPSVLHHARASSATACP
jgi:hypothetical protein